jgi:aspartyl-tRNA(Asn)/glutamyl-tRNA(Gln) amidotransferase subunit B
MTGHEPWIGLEVHVQLRTATKLFCADACDADAPPNTQVCPVCLGMPGALPVLNRRAVELAVRAALGLGSTVHRESTFARKSYFYPDLPKGYQVTQYDRPLATGGGLAVPAIGAGSVPIRRVHLEEDAGRLLHGNVAGATAVDFNRAGVPLVEIVTEPALREPAHARAFLDVLKQLLRYLGVSDCDMERGSLRVDANVSLQRPGAGQQARTELKNMNSFSAVERALSWEIRRQRRVLEGGGAVLAETLLWDADAGETRSMRSKEETQDYRYFTEPDLPILRLDERLLGSARTGWPELPAARQARLREEYRLPEYDAAVLTADRRLADYFEAVAAACAVEPRRVAGWITTDLLALLNRTGRDTRSIPIAPARLAELIELVTAGTMSRAAARTVLRLMAEEHGSPAELMRRHGLEQEQDAGRLERWVNDVIGEHAAEVARVRDGETKLLAFLMGRIMERSAGRADPVRTSQLLRERIGS